MNNCTSITNCPVSRGSKQRLLLIYKFIEFAEFAEFPADTHFNRKHKFVIKTPEVKPVATKESDGAINVNSTNNKVPPIIDTTRLLFLQDNFYVPHIEIPNYPTDIVIASDRYIWACLHNQKDLPPFYLDRLYNPQPVYDHDPDFNHAKYFKTPAKIVGYVLRAVMTPYAP